MLGGNTQQESENDNSVRRTGKIYFGNFFQGGKTMIDRSLIVFAVLAVVGMVVFHFLPLWAGVISIILWATTNYALKANIPGCNCRSAMVRNGIVAFFLSYLASGIMLLLLPWSISLVGGICAGLLLFDMIEYISSFL